MKQQHVIITVLVLLICAGGLHAAADEVQIPLSQEQLIARALDIMGRDRMTDVKTPDSVTLVTLVDSTTPFLSDQLNGRKAYRVELKNQLVTIELNTGREVWVHDGVRDFELYFDSAGTLLKIVSTLDSYYDKVASGEITKPLSAEAEKRLWTGVEKRFGFTAIEPKPCFLRALDVVRGDAIKADQVIGMFIEDRRKGGGPPVWVIDMYGLSLYESRHVRCIVDTTGNMRNCETQSTSHKPWNPENRR